MTGAQYIQRLGTLKSRLREGFQVRVGAAAADLAALVKDRIVQTGRTYTGGAFSPYSEKEGPAFWYKGRSRKQSEEVAVTALAKKGKGVSYKKFRELNGLNTNIKNFEFTGRMWRSVVVEVEGSALVVRATVQGDDDMARDLLRWHSEREGSDLLQPSPKEVQEVEQGLKEWAENLIKDSLT